MGASEAVRSSAASVAEHHDDESAPAAAPVVIEFEPVERPQRRRATRAEWATAAGLAASLVGAAAALAPRVL